MLIENSFSSAVRLVNRVVANPFFRLACLAAASIVIVELFWLGAKPIAVGLIPPPWDKLAHVTTFLTISLLLWLGAGLSRRFGIMSAVLVLACADELHQTWLPGRSADWQDLAADIFALILFLAIATAYSKFTSATTTVPSSIRSD